MGMLLASVPGTNSKVFQIDVLHNVAQAENNTTTVNSLEEKIGKLRRASLLLKVWLL